MTDSSDDFPPTRARAEDTPSAAPRAARSGSGRLLARVSVALVFLVCVTLAYHFNPDFFKHVPDELRRLVAAHPAWGPLLLAAVYIACCVFMIPVWWVQLLAGATLGMAYGTGVCLASAVVTATLTNRFAHRLAGDELIHRLGPTVERLRDHAARSGLRTVAVVRLTHVTPFALANYAFGLLGLRDRDVALGTLIGSGPMIAFYAALGSGGLRRAWHTIAGVIAVNLILLAVVWLMTRKRAGVAADSAED